MKKFNMSDFSNTEINEFLKRILISRNLIDLFQSFHKL